MEKIYRPEKIIGMPPLIGTAAKILILGSMPGNTSLDAGEYYAHPRNAFWTIMGDLFGAGPEKTYAERVKILLKQRIAVWNIYGSCFRRGSLDANIKNATYTELGEILATHPIETVVLNGKGLEHRSLDIPL